MKISQAMVEAGITQLVKSRRLTDATLVADVYSAMEKRRQTDEALAKVNPQPHKYEHQAFPAWMYGPEGEARLFERADDVPEGWSDRPISEEVHVLERDRHVPPTPLVNPVSDKRLAALKKAREARKAKRELSGS